MRLAALLSIFALSSLLVAKDMTEGKVTAKSLSKLTFAPDGTLFIGDSIGARIFALDLGDNTPVATVKPLTINDLESKIGPMMGTDAKDVLVHDMAVNPVSKNVYVTVSRGKRGFRAGWQLPNDAANASVLLKITPAGEISEVKLDKVKHSSIEITNPIAEGKPAASWKKAPESERADVVSDMHYLDGKLYVAGLSNEEFASTMRIFSYPFDSAQSTQLEIYHGAHGKWETESPVRSFLPYTLNGKKHLIASYLCTPVVLFPVDTLKDKTKVKGTTIAELGFGNQPVDMLTFRGQGGKEWLMVVNSTRGLMRISAEELAKPHTGITTRADAWTGVKIEQERGQGVLMAENFGEKHVLMLQRHPLTGALNLWSAQVSQ
jgi:hypothetical protein